MLLEISIAVGYIQSQLYTKLPRRRIDNFGDELTKLLSKMYQNHWFADDPKKDSNYRALNTNKSEISPVLIEAANSSNLEWSEISQCLPKGLIIELDPGNVTCQFSSNSSEVSTFNNSPNNTPPSMNNVLWNNSSSGCSSASSEISNTNQMISHTLYSSSNETLTEVNKISNNSSDVLDSLKLEAIFADEGIAFPPSENWLPISNQQAAPKNIFNQRQPCLLNSSSTMSGTTTSSASVGPSAFIQYNKSLSNPTPQPTTSSRVLALAANQSNPELIMMKNTPDTPKPTPPAATPSVNNSASNQAFTAAMFAQTKFGSTKLKSNTKKNKRFVSPNDLTRTPQPNANSESNGSSHIYNHNQKQESNNTKQEMLREALQYQQQLLNNVEFRNNPNYSMKLQSNIPLTTSSTTAATAVAPTLGSTIAPPSGANQSRISALFGNKNVGQQDTSAWPTPIGAQRKSTIPTHQSYLFNPINNELDGNAKGKNDFSDAFFEDYEKSRGTFWPMQAPMPNPNPWSGFSLNDAGDGQSRWTQVGSDPSNGNEIFSSPFLFSPIGQGNGENGSGNNSDEIPIQQFASINLDSITL